MSNESRMNPTAINVMLACFDVIQILLQERLDINILFTGARF